MPQAWIRGAAGAEGGKGVGSGERTPPPQWGWGAPSPEIFLIFGVEIMHFGALFT